MKLGCRRGFGGHPDILAIIALIAILAAIAYPIFARLRAAGHSKVFIIGYVVVVVIVIVTGIVGKLVKKWKRGRKTRR